jgi:WG containing repeat
MGEIHNVLTTAPAYAFAGAAPTNDLFQDGLAFVEKGFIDAKGNLLIPYEADSVVLIQPFKDGRAIIKRWVDKAKTQVIWALIDKTGKVYYESLPSDNH